MSQEIELKLQLTARTARQLARHPLINTLPARTLDLLNTYYDTPDLALTARRIALRFRKKGDDWLLTVKSAEPAAGGLAMRSEWETAAAPGQFDFSHVDHAELRHFLEGVHQQLTPVFTTHFRRTAWQVEHGDSLIELALDQGEVESCGRREPISEIELELISGQLGDLFSLTRALQAALPLHPAVASKAERGYALFHDTRAEPVRGHPVALADETTPVAAFQQIALACLEHFQRNESGLLGDDPEYVHQARVALRKLRSALKLFSPVLPKIFVDRWNAAWRDLASALGATRDWDVLLADTLPPLAHAFPVHPDIRRLSRQAQRQRRASRAALKALLEDKEHPRRIVDFLAELLALPAASTAVDLPKFVRRRLRKREEKTLALATAHRRLNDSERHELRVEIKRLRYALDFFAPLLPPSTLRPYQRALVQLQDTLGRLNDLISAEALVRDCLKPRHAGPVQGWLAGQHALLLDWLPEQLAHWQAQALPTPGKDD